MLFDHGPVHAGRHRGDPHRPAPGPRVRQQPVARALASAIGGTLVGFLFAFTAARGRLDRALLTALDAAVLLPLVSPPFTIGDRDDLLVRAARPHHLRAARLEGRHRLRSHEHAVLRELTYFPIAYLTLRPLLAGDRFEHRGDGAVARRVALARVSHGDAAAGDPRPRQCIPAAVRGVARRFRDAADPRGQQLSGAADAGIPADHRAFDLRGGAVLSFVLLVPALVVFLLQRYWVSRRFYVTITGKGAGQTPFDSVAPWRAQRAARGMRAGRRHRRSISMRCCSTRRWWWRSAPTTRSRSRHYRVIFTEGLKAIRDTLIIAGIAMPLGGLYGVLVGYLVTREGVPGPPHDGDHVDDRLRAARHDRRHRVSDRVQRAADRDHGHRAHHHRLLHLPLWTYRHPHDGRAAAADRPEPRGGIAGARAPAAARRSAA